MVRNIGLIDWDVLGVSTPTYYAPNYNLGLAYAYLSKDKNLSVKLVSNLSSKNLAKYDELYIFSSTNYFSHPSTIIKDYYKKTIKEYGRGFSYKELRPFIKETFYEHPDFTCYNPILYFSIMYPKDKYSWKIRCSNHKFNNVMLFDTFNGNEIRRDINISGSYIMIHDNPEDILNNEAKLKILYDIIETKPYKYIDFAQGVNISKITNTKVIERLFNDYHFWPVRNHLILTEANQWSTYWYNLCKEHKSKRLRIRAFLNYNFKEYEILYNLLFIVNFIKTTDTRIKIFNKEKSFKDMNVGRFAYYFYTAKERYFYSFYEWYLRIISKNHGMDPDCIYDNDYRSLMDSIGRDYDVSLRYICDFIDKYPETKEWILEGGKHDDWIKNKYYDERRSLRGFNCDISGISDNVS